MNCKLLIFCCISILLFFFNSYSIAQEDTQATKDSSIAIAEEDSVNDDPGNVADTFITKTVFENAHDSILNWKQGREFGYMAYLDSLLRKKTGLRIDTVSIDKGTINKSRAPGSRTGSNSNSFLNSLAVKVFFWALAIFFIGFILYKLFFSGGLFAKGNTKADDGQASKEPELLNEYSEYNALIQGAELKKDFNLSVRYLYLQSLKKLADSELIIFSADKTNNLYVQELAGRSYQQEFAFLTLNYEYVWYGRFTVDIARYQQLKRKFVLFNKRVQHL